MADGRKTLSDPSDEQVLAAPADYTVEEVTSALERAPEGRIEAVKVAERGGENRKGIMEWAPAPPADTKPVAVKYSASEWKERARSEFGRSPHFLAAALCDAKPGQLFTKAQAEKAIAALDPEEDS